MAKRQDDLTVFGFHSSSLSFLRESLFAQQWIEVAQDVSSVFASKDDSQAAPYFEVEAFSQIASDNPHCGAQKMDSSNITKVLSWVAVERAGQSCSKLLHSALRRAGV